MQNADFLGAYGGRLALAFGAGCVACWGFLKAILFDPRIRALEDENARCNDRVSQLEGMLYGYSGNMRQAMQAALSEEHIERIQSDAARRAES